MSRANLLNNKMFQREYRSSSKMIKCKTKGVLSDESCTDTVSSYLNKRLAEINVKHVMAIPGDYIAEWVETLDDPEVNAGLVRVHPNNEMLATYAADGYGRALNGKTVGCVAFTYGVGALNAVQAVAGAHVEYVPLVMINGSPSIAQFNSQRDQGILWHHMFDGSLTDLNIFQQITQMAVRIDNPAYAPDLIDAALTACITYSRPVYIEIANNIEHMPCELVENRADLERSPVPQSITDLDNATNYIIEILVNAENLVIMGGVEVARDNIKGEFKKLIKLLKAPYVSSLLGKGIISEYDDEVYFSGVYNGQNSQENVQQLIQNSDVLMSLGVLETDFNFTGVAAADYDPKNAKLPINGQIEVRQGAVKINGLVSKEQDGEVYWGNVGLKDLIANLIKRFEYFVKIINYIKENKERFKELENLALEYPEDFKKLVFLAKEEQEICEEIERWRDALLWNHKKSEYKQLEGSPWDIPELSNTKDDDQVTWDSFKSLFQHNYLNTFTEETAPVVLADTGLTFYSLNNIKVPENGFIAQLAWGAIGYSPAASYGVKLALEDQGINRRVISISGDGAISESINCLGTIAELGQDNVIFVMANGVFAIEQFLINVEAFSSKPDAPKFKALTQVPQSSLWDWVKLAEGFGGVGYEVTSNKELKDVLEKIKSAPPKPTTSSGPCSGDGGSCEFGEGSTVARRSTFTLVAVRNVCKDLPSNTKWKLEPEPKPDSHSR